MAHELHREVDEIKRKMVTAPWPQYLSSLTITGLRGWQGEEIQFQFPLTVISGENGSGKSTILKAAAAAYIHPTDRKLSFYPDVFFPVTPWEAISGVTLTYKLRQGTTDRAYSVRKKNTRWRGMTNRARRHVVLQDISRTLPIDATVGYARLAKKGVEVAATSWDAQLTQFYSSILGRPYTSIRLAQSDADQKKSVGVVQQGLKQFSQFHQGAGEDATLDLLNILKDVPDYSLVLIDEVEASLHPRSQRRLIHYLLWLARTKQMQVILTTHSEIVLEELPLEARVFIQRQSQAINVLYGVTPSFALNRMDDSNRTDLFVFVEDKESAILVTEIIRYRGLDLRQLSILEVGPANIVYMLGQLAFNSRLPIKGLGVLDADKSEHVNAGTIALPGLLAPEREVFTTVHSNATHELSSRLNLSASSVEDALSTAMTLPDHHEWLTVAARTLSQSIDYLWTTMCKVWIEHIHNYGDFDEIAERIKKIL